MIAGLIDHVWQSVVFFLAMWLAVASVRRHTARLRLWMWRAAALKFVLPFWLLFACGAWLGFPVDQPSDLPPPVFIAAVRTAPPVVAPVRTAGPSGYPLAVILAVMLSAAITCLRAIQAGVRLERGRARAEAARLERDPDDIEPSPGFVHAAILSALCVVVVSAPVLAGATHDRVRRHDLLMANATVLRRAHIVMDLAAPGMGNRPRVIANAKGVVIRNANVQDLVAIAYGVNQLSVWYVQMFYEDTPPEIKYWVYTPRYDVRVAAPIRAPEEFDSYALRQVVTKLLAERFGLEVYVQQKCQPPCGVYNVPLPPVQ
jgi:hypothetical protein